MIELFIALKHIRERKRQSLIAILGVTIGITVLAVSLGVANGLDNNMIKSILSMGPHIKLSNSEASISDYEKIKETIVKNELVKGVLSEYSTQGILRYEGNGGTFVCGVMVQGLKDEDAKEVLELDKKIIVGKMDLSKSNNVLIGKELFQQLNAKIGEKIKVISAENKDFEGVITGVFQSGYLDFDTNMVLLPLETVQILSDVGDVVNVMDVRLKDVYQAPRVAEKIRNETGLTARTWGELNKNLLEALTLEKSVMVVLLSLIIIIAAFVIAVILNTSVKEKTKDIGILRSVGFSRNNIMKIFLLEGIILGGTGIITGVIMSLVVIFILKANLLKLPIGMYYLDKLPVDISIKDYAIILVATSAIVFLSSIQPAYKAAKLTPVEALRYE